MTEKRMDLKPNGLEEGEMPDEISAEEALEKLNISENELTQINSAGINIDTIKYLVLFTEQVDWYREIVLKDEQAKENILKTIEAVKANLHTLRRKKLDGKIYNKIINYCKTHKIEFTQAELAEKEN